MTETKYSREPFEGYTHRFMVRFYVKDNYYEPNLTLYSNNESYASLLNFIEEKKHDWVLDYEIIHRATKEQDDLATEFLKEINF